MDIVCPFTSGYLPIYDDEYGCVHYDDDGYALHDIRGFANLRTSGYRQLARLWWAQGMYELSVDSCLHVWVMLGWFF